MDVKKRKKLDDYRQLLGTKFRQRWKIRPVGPIVKAGPVTYAWLANQIGEFRILARSDAWEKNKYKIRHSIPVWNLRVGYFPVKHSCVYNKIISQLNYRSSLAFWEPRLPIVNHWIRLSEFHFIYDENASLAECFPETSMHKRSLFERGPELQY